jgi:putative peptidoglycan lipid II flippase
MPEMAAKDSGNEGQGRQGRPGANVLRSASVVGVMTAFSRVLGLAREIAMGYLFGTSALKSAFDIAFLIPNLSRRLFGEGVLSSAFVPVFGETLVKEGREAAFRFASRVLLSLGVLLSGATAVVIALSYPVAGMLPADSKWLLPLPMMRVMLPYAVLICLAATLGGVLNTLGAFGIPALTPFLLNAFWLGVLGVFIFFPGLVADPQTQLMVLCVAILVAGVSQVLFLLPAMRRRGFRLGWELRGWRGDGKLLRVLWLFLPAALGMGLIQINVMVDKALAYWADASAPAALEYAERITYLPLGMFATAFMTVLLPTFSRQYARGAFGEMRETLERAVRHLGIIMAPCSLALMVLAPVVIQAIYTFKGGKFGEESVILSGRALAAYAPGLLVFSLQKVLMPAFYGMQDMKTPVKVSVCCLMLNVTLNVASVLTLPHGWKHCGIAGSTVFTSLVNSWILFALLRRKPCAPRLGAMAPSLAKSLVAACVMAAAAVAVWHFGGRWMGAAMGRKLVQLGLLGVTIAAGVAVYGGIMLVISRAELAGMVGELVSRRRKR